MITTQTRLKYLLTKHLASTLRFYFCASATLLLLNTIEVHAAETPQQVIEKVDAIRNPSENYSMKVEVKNMGTSDAPSTFEVMLSGNSKTLIKTLEPSRDRGRNFLMLNEDMWAYLPNLGRAVRVSLSQKLTGQAANGDISRMSWSSDYAATLESETPKEWVILLSANKKGLTYEKVRAYVEKSTYRPLHADFLTGAGKPLKRATYANYKTLAGKERPTEIMIQDAIRESEKSRITIESMQTRSYPASLFNPKSLE